MHKTLYLVLLPLKNTENAEDQPDSEKSLYDKLKESLDTARDLTDTLKREKWRLSRRELSLNLRMGELEDYKKHMKEDMVGTLHDCHW